jgi:hypothetical protein
MSARFLSVRSVVERGSDKLDEPCVQEVELRLVFVKSPGNFLIIQGFWRGDWTKLRTALTKLSQDDKLFDLDRNYLTCRSTNCPS